MGKSKFEIGETEKHTILVNNNLFMKHITIEVDGASVADEYHYSPKGKKFEFDVGSVEKHHVEVNVGGFSTTELLVDGKPVQES
jgi:hypothetical protein